MLVNDSEIWTAYCVAFKVKIKNDYWLNIADSDSIQNTGVVREKQERKDESSHIWRRLRWWDWVMVVMPKASPLKGFLLSPNRWPSLSSVMMPEQSSGSTLTMTRRPCWRPFNAYSTREETPKQACAERKGRSKDVCPCVCTVECSSAFLDLQCVYMVYLCVCPVTSVCLYVYVRMHVRECMPAYQMWFSVHFE